MYDSYIIYSWNLHITIARKKYSIVREIYTFVMRLCTGHDILSRKIRVTKSQTYAKSSCHIVV